jgi:hypothetical protein
VSALEEVQTAALCALGVQQHMTQACKHDELPENVLDSLRATEELAGEFHAALQRTCELLERIEK